MIRENGGWDTFKMLEIKKFPCNDDREACAEEDKVIKEMKANMNSNSALLDKEKGAENKKQYYIENKESIKEYKKTYYEENREKLLAEKKQYYYDNIDTINKRSSDVVQCQCGCFLTRKAKGSSRHIQSQRHKDGMKTFAPKIV
jgi:hypothetical protein